MKKRRVPLAPTVFGDFSTYLIRARKKLRARCATCGAILPGAGETLVDMTLGDKRYAQLTRLAEAEGMSPELFARRVVRRYLRDAA